MPFDPGGTFWNFRACLFHDNGEQKWESYLYGSDLDELQAECRSRVTNPNNAVESFYIVNERREVVCDL